MHRIPPRFLHWLALGLLVVSGCRGEQPATVEPQMAGRSPGARPDIVATLRQDLETKRHPADGGGRAWLEPDADGTSPAAGSRGKWTVVYEAGPLGVAAGGMVFLQVSPFWGWSTPQVMSPDGPGFTEVSTSAEGVELRPRTLDQQLLGIEIADRSLAPGERLRIVYGAGPLGARADLYAERESPLWIAVDGDGDGVRGLVPNSPTVAVPAGAPAQLALTLPSTARPGDTVHLTAAVLDAVGNAGVEIEGALQLRSSPEGTLRLPTLVRLGPGDGGLASIEVEVAGEGTARVEGQAPGALRATSNPIVVSDATTRVLWGDLHGHSSLSDGTGTPEDYYRYARDVAALDLAALTDHDHWGMQPLATHPELWERIRGAAEQFNEPGRFVTLLGYEWTSWIHGHRHVLYFGNEGEVLSSVDPAYESPPQLWEALRGQPALTFAHHSAGGPIATNWAIPPDPELEPVTEIASVHGSSEAPDSPKRIYSPVSGNFARDALDRGYRLGFVGSGDGHDGHPGLARLASPSGGLAAILSESLTREGVLAALRARRAYATNGPRIHLEVVLDGHAMGSLLEAGSAGKLSVRVVAVGALERVDLVRSGQILESVAGDGPECAFTRTVHGLTAGEYLYVRAVQADGGAAWSSPFFVR